MLDQNKLPRAIPYVPTGEHSGLGTKWVNGLPELLAETHDRGMVVFGKIKGGSFTVQPVPKKRQSVVVHNYGNSSSIFYLIEPLTERQQEKLTNAVGGRKETFVVKRHHAGHV